MSDHPFVVYEELDEGRIVRVMLNRPDARNAQSRGLLVELNEALLRAEADDQVRVVILGGMGPMSVNQSVDNMGFYNALNACFTLHELNHAHWAQLNEDKFPIAKEEHGGPNWRSAPPIVRAEKDKVRADK